MLKQRHGAMDMTTGAILKQIIVFGLPILLGSIFQQFYSMVDSIVVGNYVGPDALAAVGSASTISHCLVMMATGLTTGASVVVAQLFGAKRYEDIRRAISTTMIFAFIVAVAVTVLGIAFGPALMRLVRVPEALMADSVIYLQIYVGGTLFLMLYNFFAAMLRALGDSTTPLIFLIIASILNIVGDLYFVLSLHMGVPGVALATVLAQAVSVALCAVYCLLKVDYFKFRKGEFGFYRDLFRDILRLSVPSAIQSCLGSAGFVLVQGLINSFGETCMAAYTAASKLESVAHLPIECITMSLSVFTGQNMGAGNVKRVKRGLWQTILAGSAVCIVIAALVFTVGPRMISLFVNDSEVEVIETGAAFMRIWAPLTVVFVLMNCFASVLRGAGDSLIVMLTSFSDLGMRALMAYVLALACGLGFMGIAYAMFCGWFTSCVVAALRYWSGKWKTMTITGAQTLRE